MNKHFKLFLISFLTLLFLHAEAGAMELELQENEEINPLRSRPIQPTGNFFEKVSATEDQNVSANGTFAIYLRSAIIRHLSDPDWCGKDEGTIVLNFTPPGGKAMQTTLYWSGTLQKFFACSCLGAQDALTFEYGEHLLVGYAPLKDLTQFGFSVSVIDNEEDDAKKWKSASTVLDSVSKMTSAVPQYGAAISAGVEVFSGFADLISQLHHNTTQLFYAGDFLLYDGKNDQNEKDVKDVNAQNLTGMYNVGYRRTAKNQQNASDKTPNVENASDKTSDIELHFQAKVLPVLPDPQKYDTGVRVILETLDIPQAIRKKIAKNNLFITAQKLAVFEVQVGGTSTKYEVYPNAFKEDRFDVSNVEVYKGAWNPAGLPTSVSLVCSEQGTDFSKVLAAVGTLTKSLIPADKPGEKFGANAIASPLIGMTQTASSGIIASLAPQSEHALFSVGTDLLRGTEEDLQKNIKADPTSQTIIFPMYSNKKQKPLGNISAQMKIVPCAIEKKNNTGQQLGTLKNPF